MHTLSGGRQRLEMWTTRPDQSLLLTDRLTKVGDQYSIMTVILVPGYVLQIRNDQISDSKAGNT